jgi:DNA primase
MFYPENIIEEIMSANDIFRCDIRCVHLTKKGTTYFGLCPFHNEKTPSFSVSPGKQMYYCFGCGEGGNVITFVMKYENYNFSEALHYLADRAGISLPEREMTPEEKKKTDIKGIIYEINKEAAKYFYVQLKSKRGEGALKYLKDRELSEEIIIKFGLGFANKYSDDLYKYLKSKKYSDEILNQTGLVSLKENGSYDKFWNRVMFPIMNANNKVIAFGGRVMGEGEPKYLNSPETLIFDKSRNLYGLNFARSSREEYLIVCEGYMDVITMHQAGFTNAVATLGTALTKGHAGLIKRYSKEVYLAYDSDGAGEKAALRAIPILKDVGLGTKVIDFSPAKDPDEFIKKFGKEALEQRIKTGRKFFYI